MMVVRQKKKKRQKRVIFDLLLAVGFTGTGLGLDLAHTINNIPFVSSDFRAWVRGCIAA